MERIVISGINGFIGSSIAKYFLNKGHRVCGLVRTTSNLSLLKNLDIEYVYGDIGTADSLKTLFKKDDMAIHVAGFASDWGSYEKFHTINVQGTKNFTLAAEQAKVRRLVHISTVALLGFNHKKKATEADPPVKTIFPYNETKRLAEAWLFEYAVDSAMEICAIRPGNVFGPEDHTFIDKYIEALEQGKIAYIDGGRHYTCPTYIEHLCQAIYLAATHPNAPGEIFNITDDLTIDWKTFTNALADAMDLKRPKLSVPFSLVYGISFIMEMIYKILRIKAAPLLTRYRACNGGRDYHFSVEKAKEVLGYSPHIPFEECVSRTVTWYKNRNGAIS